MAEQRETGRAETVGSPFEHMATKEDVANVRTEIEGVRTEIANVRTDLKTEIEGVRTEIANVRSDLKTEIEGLRTYIERVRSDLNDRNRLGRQERRKHPLGNENHEVDDGYCGRGCAGTTAGTLLRLIHSLISPA